MTVTYGERAGQPAHLSFFRRGLERRARPIVDGDPVHEYLIDQANLRGFLGAYSAREDLGDIDVDLSLEDIVVGLLQPHAPAEPRVLKLVLRILQSDQCDPDRLVFRAQRERAIDNLLWLLELVPDSERNAAVHAVTRALERHPPRAPRRPNIRYDATRLVYRGPR